MKCTKCHNITNDNSKFCSTCGAEMDEAVAEIHRDINKSEKRTKVTTVIFVIGIILAALVVFLMWEGPKPEILISEYIYLEVGGFEGEGRVFPRINNDGLEKVIAATVDEEITELQQYHIEQLVNSISLDYEKKDIWKNGEKRNHFHEMESSTRV